MKQGRTLHEVSQELKRQQETKRDFIAPTDQLTMKLEGKIPKIEILGIGDFGIKTFAHNQIGSRVGIPTSYYNRMLAESPELLVQNVNHWFKSQPEQRMVRTLDQDVRAVLSNSYRAMDNFDLANAVLPPMMKQELDLSNSSFEVTDSRMYLKAVFPKIQAEIRKGDTVQSGLCVSNSEIGRGGLCVEPMVFTLACLNGLIVKDASIKKIHLGRGIEVASVEEFLRDSTKRLQDEALWSAIHDVTSSMMKPEVFQRIVDRMKKSTEKEITSEPVKVIELVKTKLGLSDQEGSSVLDQLIRGKDLTQYGLLNAVTAASQKLDYDRATEFEKMGNEILELTETQWSGLMAAAA